MSDIEWIYKCIQDAEINNDLEMLDYFYNLLDEMQG